jgi:signal transduction histidine kinase
MSAPLYAPQLRPERLIAAGRIVLAVSSLFAVWLDVDEPVRHAPLAYGVLAGYLLYAAVVAWLLSRLETVPHPWPVVIHTIDLVCFSLFIFFTEGPASPFTVYFVFALLSATLRWQARGTMWTAIIVSAAFFGFGVYFAVVLDDPTFDLRALIIRGVYLIVLAGLLAYVGTQDQRTLREMWSLAAWPTSLQHDAAAVARDLVSYAAPLLDAPTVVLAWVEHDTPWRWFGTWRRGDWSHQRDSADLELVHDTLRDRAFIHTVRPRRRTLVLEGTGPQLDLWHGEPLARSWLERFGSDSVVSVPIPGQSFTGRLFVLDKADATLDDLVLAEVVAGVMAGRLDAFHLTEELRHAAATEERIRLARDLHDGVLQSFTGVALRLAAIRRSMESNPSGAASALQDVQKVLAVEQRDLRFLIQELRPSAAAADATPFSLRLDELARRMEREWDLRVDLTDARAGDVPAEVARDMYHIVREALVNAAKHGGATRVRVSIAGDGSAGVALTIVDNGRGFPFTGRRNLDELARLSIGPKTLRERVAAMNGSLAVESGPMGASLAIGLPVRTV